ncbi:MAG TPA: hypothetical protein VGB33_03605 [Acidimicrobiia bacterium]|jgi:hypothetical protein
MDRVRPILLLVVSLQVLAACGTPTDAIADGSSTTIGAPASSTSLAPTTSTSTPPVDALEVIVAPDETGTLPPELRVGCPFGPSFPLGALAGIRPLEEADPGGVAEAVQPFLAGEEGRFWPQDGWLILHETREHILLVARDENGSLAHMSVSRSQDGWMWDGASSGGPCPLQFLVPEGLNTVEWRLDPTAPAPRPADRAIPVLLTERECVSGQEIGDRLVGPQIVMIDSSIRIAFAANPPEGDAFTCQGNPETPFVLELPQPIGDREIIEGYGIGIQLEDYLD